MRCFLKPKSLGLCVLYFQTSLCVGLGYDVSSSQRQDNQLLLRGPASPNVFQKAACPNYGIRKRFGLTSFLSLPALVRSFYQLCQASVFQMPGLFRTPSQNPLDKEMGRQASPSGSSEDTGGQYSIFCLFSVHSRLCRHDHMNTSHFQEGIPAKDPFLHLNSLLTLTPAFSKVN